jgi:hypothetical protein
VHTTEALLQEAQVVADRDRRTFSFRVDLGPDALWEHLCAHEDVRVSNDPAPGPPPPHGAAFLAARTASSEIRLRRWAGPADAASPIVVVDLVEGERGTEVRGRLVPGTTRSLGDTRSAWRRYALPTAAILTALGVGGAILGGGWAALALPLLLLLIGVPAGAVMIPLLVMWNRQSREVQTEALWGVVGEVFTPLALPEAEDPGPFR